MDRYTLPQNHPMPPYDAATTPPNPEPGDGAVSCDGAMGLGTDLQSRGDAAGTGDAIPIHPHGRTQARPPTAPILCRKNLTLGA